MNNKVLIIIILASLFSIQALNAQEKNKTFTVNGVTFEMVYVEGGTFTMGCTSEQGDDCWECEKPSHSVTLSDYYIGKYEVTQELWYAVMGYEPKNHIEDALYGWFYGWINERGKGNNYPAYNVCWSDTQDFIHKLNQLTGQNFCLPTEAEWEYAARGGKQSKHYKYSGSNNPDDVGWFTLDNYFSKRGECHPVGGKKPNELGIYDMTGNVSEWCQDRYEMKGYDVGHQINPTGPSSNSSYHVVRGGNYFDCDIYKLCRSRVSFRSGFGNESFPVTGFRIALH